MKKILKVTILSSLLIIGMILFSQKSNAVTLNMDCTTQEKNVKDGDEISVSATVNGEEYGKIMAIFGYLFYDKDAVELIPSEEDSNSAKIELGTGWSIGNLSLGNSNESNQNATSSDENAENTEVTNTEEGTAEEANTEENNVEETEIDEAIPKFLIYSNDKNREDTAVIIKFKVKDAKKFKNSEISIKNITLYDSEHNEVQADIEDSILKINETQALKNKNSNTKVIIISLFVVIVLVGVALYIFYKQKENNDTAKKVMENTGKSVKKEENKEEKKEEKTEIKEHEEKKIEEEENKEKVQENKNKDNKNN